MKSLKTLRLLWGNMDVHVLRRMKKLDLDLWLLHVHLLDDIY